MNGKFLQYASLPDYNPIKIPAKNCLQCNKFVEDRLNYEYQFQAITHQFLQYANITSSLGDAV